MGKAVWQAFFEHKVADQDSAAAGFSLGTGGEVRKWMSRGGGEERE